LGIAEKLLRSGQLKKYVKLNSKTCYSVGCLMPGTSITANRILPAAIKTSSASDCQISCQNLLACQVKLSQMSCETFLHNKNK